MSGKFVISLDFELLWGVRDNPEKKINKDAILNVWVAIPRILDIFKSYKVSATFATVGFLFAEDQASALKFVPKNLPKYHDVNLSPYDELYHIDDKNNPYYFALDVINQLKEHDNIEIGTHTFSHFYCLEPGISKDDFEEDLASALSIAKAHNINITSIIFPRNQYNEAFKEILIKNNIIAYRGLEPLKIYDTNDGNFNSKVKKGLRMLDTYLPIFPHSIYDLKKLSEGEIANIPSSRFLRPYSNKLNILESLKINRIKKGMTKAARENKLYHLWWHPHNFGSNLEKNIDNLIEIMEHYKHLNKKYGFESESMTSLSKKILANE